MKKKTPLNHIKNILSIIALCLLVMIILNPLVLAEVGSNSQVAADLGGNNAIIQPRVEFAFDLYEQSGLSKYFEELSLLWTESLKRRLVILPGIPKANPELASKMREELIIILQYDPQNIKALTLAGDYHYYFGQKGTALWYYQQATKLQPQSIEACLPLADYYLVNWQPEKVLELLKDFNTSEAYLRKGAAYLQLGNYPLSLGYLQQTVGLSKGFRQTRDKDLLKARLNLGDFTNAKNLSEKITITSETGKLCLIELQGWLELAENKSINALEKWENGKSIPRNYPYWDYYCYWLQLGELGIIGVLPDLNRDPEYRAVLRMIEGQSYLKQGMKEEANRTFQEALKPERKLLLAYLELANIQISNKNYNAAIKWLNKGLEINPQFVPFFLKRTEIYEKMGQTEKVNEDRETIAKLNRLNLGSSAKCNAIIHRTATGQSFLSVRGQVKDLNGFWVSKDQKEWRYYPWAGQALRLDKGTKELLILPIGNSLTGEFIRVSFIEPETVKLNTPLVIQENVLITLPYESRLVVESFSNQEFNRVIVASQPGKKHTIPSTFFKPGIQEIQFWYQDANGNWNGSKAQITVLKDSIPNHVEYQIITNSSLVNHRWIKLQADTKNKVTGTPMISLGENGQMSEWIPFKELLDYQLTPGDGLKRVQARIMDEYGRITESSIELVLDTTLPRVSKAQLGKQFFKKTLVWEINEAVDCRLNTFSEDGKWNLITVQPSTNGHYKIELNEKVVFCQWILTDQAGNRNIINDPQINSKLRESLDVSLSINYPVRNDPYPPQSFSIEVRPEAKSLFEWSLSNNLQHWSSRFVDDNPVRWRVNAGLGQSILYVRYRTKANEKLKYQAIPVFLPEIPDKIVTE